MSYLVLFDVDHTLLKINSGEAVLRKAYRTGLLSLPKFLHALWMAGRYKLHLKDPYKIMHKFAEWMGGAPVRDFEEFCNDLCNNSLLPALRPELIEEVRKHKEQGAHILILSSAFRAVCEPLAAHFDMDGVLCSELEKKDGVYTGKTYGPLCFREEKFHRMEEYLCTRHYTREEAYYYGDSTDDLAVLKAVGHPVCVYPKGRLKRIAKRNNWRMIQG